MSVQALGWVLDHSPEAGSRRLVLIALANHAGRENATAWPAVETIMREAKVSRRTAYRSLRELEESGAIVRTGVMRTGTVIYRVVMRRRPSHEVTEGGANLTPPDADEGGANLTPPAGEPVVAGGDEGGATGGTGAKLAPVPNTTEGVPNATSRGVTGGTRTVRNRKEPDPTGADAPDVVKSADPDKGPNELVARYADRCAALGVTVPREVRDTVGAYAKKLLDQGQPFDVVAVAVDLLVDRRLHPGLLPTLILEAGAGPRVPAGQAGEAARRYGPRLRSAGSPASEPEGPPDYGPDLTDEQRAENLAKVRELAQGIGGGGV